MSSSLDEKSQPISPNSTIHERIRTDPPKNHLDGKDQSALTVNPLNVGDEKTPPQQDSSKRSGVPRSAYGSSNSDEPAKPAVSRDIALVMFWYFWTIGPVLVTAVLLALNFSGYVIGTYLGPDDNSTSTITAIMQVAAKVHEIMMVIGLINIAQQALQRCLTKDGLLLGLLGAEQSLGNILFVLSREFRVAITYGLSRGGEAKRSPQQKRTIQLVVIMVVVCLLCTVVGPASAVLMVPGMNWFFERTFLWNTQEAPLGSYCYPYIMIDPRLGGGEFYGSVYYNSLFYESIPDYWGSSMLMRNHTDTGRFMKENMVITHQFRDNGIPVVVNSSTSWNRTLDLDINWVGGTNFSTVVQLDTLVISWSLVDYKPLAKNEDSDVQFVADMTGIESSTVCRSRRKLSCENRNDSAGNSSDWCFIYVDEDNDENIHLLQSRDLLLISDATSDSGLTSTPTNFWITEGLRTATDQRFTDAIMFVFENNTDPMFLTVCKTSAFLKSVRATSKNKIFSAEQIHSYGNHLYYFESSNTQAESTTKRTILYHENWLDMVFQDTSSNGNETETTTNIVSTPRNASQLTINHPLKAWAVGIQDAPLTKGGSLEATDASGAEAGMVEVVVGGAFVSILTRIFPSYMQYSVSSDWFDDGSWNSSNTTIREHYPSDLMPEAIIDCHYQNKTLDVYHRVYGYEPQALATILSTVVLLAHCFVVILGSIRQCVSGKIITGWTTVAEYGSLCLGTDPENAIGNTCAGIESKATLKTIVGIRESGKEGDSRNHLELVASERRMGDKERIQGPEKRYGLNNVGNNNNTKSPSTTSPPAPPPAPSV